MNDATDEYGCRPADPDWMRQVAKDNNRPGVNVRWERTVKVHDDWYKPTPRVAESLDDLAVGMQVVSMGSMGPFAGTVVEHHGDRVVARHAPNLGPEFNVWPEHRTIVILADPPAPPAPDWLVPADTMEALREALDGVSTYELTGAARAVLNAATEVER